MVLFTFVIMFIVVEFAKRNEVAVVPATWALGATQCYYPNNIKTQKELLRLVKALSPPDTTKWPVYPLRKIICSTGELKFCTIYTGTDFLQFLPIYR